MDFLHIILYNFPITESVNSVLTEGVYLTTPIRETEMERLAKIPLFRQDVFFMLL